MNSLVNRGYFFIFSYYNPNLLVMKKLMSLLAISGLLAFSSCAPNDSGASDATENEVMETEMEATDEAPSDSSEVDAGEHVTEHHEGQAKVQHLTADEMKVGASQEVKEAHLMEGDVVEDGEEVVITFAMADTKPAMPGCEDYVEEEEQIDCFHEAMIAHIQKEFRYPEKDLQQRTNLENNRTEGVVEVYFEINEEGNVERTKVVRSVNPEIDAEAIRTIESLPQMRPAIEEGEPAQVRFIVPISVRLQ